ncbi:MAG TPA: hypothetical protein VGZ27_05540 [Vicinamibacterales bacterium]|jgi:hypothetical protein|nr:hypothetical protein [Vicinamibacterales bacterium]
MRRRIFIAVVLACALLLAPGDPGVTTRAAGAGLPHSLTDQEFWQLSVDASEPSGYFRSENLTSNELQFQAVIPELVSRTRPGDVYLGVGPEQNFTYIAAVKPSMAVIFDIRRGNLLLQLMYKALFEMARDRADFVSLLFSRPRPAGLASDSPVTELFFKFSDVAESHASYEVNLRTIEDRLLKTHHFALSAADLDGVEHIYEAFYASGFRVRYSPTYDELMTATDEQYVHRSYLATEDAFRFLKDLESRNLVVPVVGDFGGSRAIRRIAAFLKTRGARVSAFYLSNVEQYLDQDGKALAFCRNVATLPLDATSTFIRSSSRGYIGYGYGYGRGFVSSLGGMLEETDRCASGR